MRLIVFQKMVTSRWHRKYFSYDVELLISEEKIKVSKHEYTIRRFMLTGFSDIALHVHFQIVSNLSG